MTVINGLCRRSILRIYADADAKNFTAVMKDWKLTTRKIDFDMTQVARKPPGQFLGIFHGNVSIRNRPFMVAPTDFVQPVFYNKFLGYDLHRSIELEGIKDIDLKDYMHRPALDDKTVTAKKKRVGQ
ncbi:hypothetical protein BaRGS_00010644 [Batillaria attramentaria]|uniref:Uncharacterized protein n=1 Tax=Batillaria attramentaria TaxID=370345 RepID=A0ABD0LF02_9CAEN